MGKKQFPFSTVFFSDITRWESLCFRTIIIIYIQSNSSKKINPLGRDPNIGFHGIMNFVLQWEYIFFFFFTVGISYSETVFLKIMPKKMVISVYSYR